METPEGESSAEFKRGIWIAKHMILNIIERNSNII